ncbi:MAG: histone deacetylase [Cytophagia bacterium]|nr:MAG: histone deacetylase [Runella sp.]TAG19279.1 MAG: histone deacetylase [Cytophagales bacterium]TAG38533.1 MAG: histone deacetylase [Cytophagia bacterium]TAG49363.1 MAG: histone deacetylase [Runella slithyformis]TAG71410.1 MAG: histone deacetylase [Runella slithyformis]
MLKIAYDALYCHPLPKNTNGEPHRFPMLKYELIPEQLLYEGTCNADNFFVPGQLAEHWILGVHNQAYWQDLQNLRITDKMVRRIGFPLSKRLIERETCIAQGTIECCHFAFEWGVAMNVAGGTHHAFADRGEGFCLLNDVAIAAHYLLENKLANQILVIDLDVHQGNGTAAIFANEPRVFTFSMHGQENYPLQKEVSDLDIGLPTGTSDAAYLNLLYQHLPVLFEQQKPDFVFYVAGVDILETDKLGKLKVTKEGCRRRDEFVFEQCQLRQMPVVVSMGGGYSPRIADIVEAHCNTYRVAQRLYF